MRMKRKSRKSREMMLRIELSSDITRFLRLFQYLVTLKIRRSLRARRTERPKEPDFTSDQITSKIDPEMTTQSKRLKLESKYVRGPSAYTFMNISNMNRARNTNSAKSVNIRFNTVHKPETPMKLLSYRMILLLVNSEAMSANYVTMIHSTILYRICYAILYTLYYTMLCYSTLYYIILY